MVRQILIDKQTFKKKQILSYPFKIQREKQMILEIHMIILQKRQPNWMNKIAMAYI